MKYFYKAVMAILSLALFPVFVFLPLIRLKFSGSIGTMINKVLGQELPKNLSLYKIIEVLNKVKAEYPSLSSSKLWENESIASIKTPLIIFAVLIAVALIMGILIFIFGVFTRKKLLTALFSAIGLACSIAMNPVFEMIAKPFMSGKISLGSLLGISLANILGSVSYLALSAVYFVFLLLFGVMTAFTIAIKVVEYNSGK
ncbi:MAG: hypothetical protein ACOX5C_01485 [Acutalibacteraceae bacterium]|jgi:hypothetical protein